jgi:hypothetical protein
MMVLIALSAFGACHSDDEVESCIVAPPPGTAQAALYVVTGPGTCANENSAGATSVTSTPNGGSFAATIRILVKGAKPNTIYFIQRAPEFPSNETSADRSCQRADGLPPWTPPNYAGDLWVTFPKPNTDQGPVKTLTTDAAGDASFEFAFHSPSIKTGTKFDVAMRLVDVDVPGVAGVTTELRSGCMTITVL